MKCESPDDFWRLVDRSDPDECWPWTGRIDSEGYPGYSTLDGVCDRGHRIAWKLSHAGDHLSPGDEVCHTCDNRRCCRPNHLFRGSREDNRLDMMNKGRNVCGERHASAKLTERDVDEIRRLHAAGGDSLGALAGRFSISKNAVWRIVHRLTWKHVA